MDKIKGVVKMKKNIIMTMVFVIMVLFVPFSLHATDYQHTLEVKDMQFSWAIEGDKIHVKLSAKTTGWVGIGFDPETAMAGANIIIGAVKNGKFKVEDHYADRKRGHKNDVKLGGTNDVINTFGSEEDGVTTISFTFPLDSGDKYDKPIKAQGKYRVMLAYGAGKDSFKNRHPYRTIYDIDLSTGENEKIK
jgi:hypothetical protein